MAENPPAFPQQCADALDVGMVHAGMSLRDYFAGQALAGWMANQIFCNATNDALKPGETFAAIIATGAYQIADAMLSERERGQ